MALTLAAATRRPLQAVTGLESVIAPTCALALLVHPTPLTWPALVVGAAPVFARWIVQGRPWRATPFDLPLALLIVSCGSGLAAAPNPQDGAIRFFGLVAALILFAWVREHAASPDASCRATVGVVVAVSTASLLLVHVAQPFLLLDRVPPLAALAGLMEPLGLYRLLSADGAALQRFRLYASGVGALAAVGLAMTGGLVLGSRSRRHLPALAVLGLWFAALLYVADNRGSMLAAAVALGCTIVWWRPRLLLLAVLFVFGTLDLMAFGMAQRGLSLRTVLERIDFWQKGLVLASETPLTGVGLGVSSVQLAYRAAFQPTNPPFNHAHNIFVQALLEQGLLGVVGLLWVCLAVARLGPTPRVAQDAGHDARHATRLRGASLALLGGSVALLAAGLTEIVALTTLGTALLLVMLGLLVAAHDAASDLTPVARVSAGVPSPPSPLSLRAGEGETEETCSPSPCARERGLGGEGTPQAPTRALIVAVVVLVFATVASGQVRAVVAVPALNLGTSALYRATLSDPGSNPSAHPRAVALAISSLQVAATIDSGSVPAWRNLALALAASGDRDGARRAADEARAVTPPDDHDALFGVGRAYAAAGAWDDAIAAWSDVGAGPQLLRLGRDLARGPDWQASISAFVAASRLGAPGRSGPDGAATTALAHGQSAEEAIAHLAPLIASGGTVGYRARLESARVYRLTGQPERAQQALLEAERAGPDDQLELERALINLDLNQPYASEAALVWIVAHPIEPADGIPDGDDPRYWLAVAQARVGKPDDALATARAGLAALSPQQASLRVPYHLLIGDTLLSLGRPVDAMTTFRAGQRLAPTDPRLADGVARAQAALRR